MRNWLVVLLICWAGYSMYGQGTVTFVNRVSGSLDAPVFDTDGTTRLEGPAYVAQLYAGPMEVRLEPVGDPVPFRTGAAAGYFVATDPDRRIPTVIPGELAWIQVKVWEAITGKSYEEALNNGGKNGVSNLFGVITGGAGTPPSTPTLLFGLRSFGLTVETATIIAPPGFSLIGNPLFKGSNTVVEVLPSVPEGTILYRFDNRTKTYSVNLFDFGRWSNEAEKLPPGEGAFLLNTTEQPVTIVFTGAAVPLARISERTTGFYLISCGGAQSCRIEQFFTFTPMEGDTFYRFVNGRYEISRFLLGEWRGIQPAFAPGESVFVWLAPPAPSP